MFAHGVRGASLDAVMAATGVSKGQLYHYFADKGDVVRAVIARQTLRVFDAQRPLLDALDSWDAIAAWFDTLVQLQEEGGCVGDCPLGSLASELVDRDEDTRGDLVNSFDAWQGYVARGLECMQSRGELVATADPVALATATLASIQGGLLLTQIHKSTRSLRLALDATFIYLRTFATAPMATADSPTAPR